MKGKHPTPREDWPARAAAQASRLFSRGQLGPKTTRTRTWVPAMVPWRSVEAGFVTADILQWYGRFAAAQPGVLVVEATGIRDIPSGPLLRIGHDRFLPGLQQLVEVVRRESAGQTRLLIQIIDFLRIRRRPEKQRFLLQYLQIRPEHRQGLVRAIGDAKWRSASEADLRSFLLQLPHNDLLDLLSDREVEALEFGARERVSDLHLDHIRELPQVLPEQFAAAASRAERAGFDGVELHYAHAYTMASFLSRRNQRDDGYGASQEGRVRLALEVLRAVQARCSEDFIIGCRLLGDEAIDGGSRIEDACYYSRCLAEAGIHFVSVSKGGKFEDARQPAVGAAVYPYTGRSGHECMPTVYLQDPPFGRNLPLARAIRQTIHAAGLQTPVVGAGGINSFTLAESALQNGDCDFVGAARQSLADPDWFQKIELGLGPQIRRCKYTNYCEALDQKHRQVTCQLWDRDFTVGDDGLPDGAIAKSTDGRRRLVAPPWRRSSDSSTA